MGAKQSKRSVDISGKEADGASEVAAGAGGEGRVEQLADIDALKPQLNGDAHIHETSEKEKQIDSGTPENEKDATTEKEGKVQEADDEKDKESSVITNGDNEQKEENVESTPSPEEAKKPKKEKVKKKWSLRSISFSRKDKPKQEKKQKEDETKTNGEPEKVPEEAAEASPENEKNEVIQEMKSETESKDEKTPETPVTEPITNGSSTPETPKDDTSATDEPINVIEETDRTEATKEAEPAQIPINGMLLQEPKHETTDPVETVNTKTEEIKAEKPEPIPAIEIPDKNEVCVEKSPLIEPSPPPLPANPPPSSVASFAVTTMAPELTDASLPNTADITSNASRSDVQEAITNINVEVVAPENEHIQSTVETEVVGILENVGEKLEETSKTNTELTHVKQSDDAITGGDIKNTELHEPVSIDIPEESIVSKADFISNDNMEIKKDVVTLPETMVDDLSEQGITCVNDIEITDNISNNDILESIERDMALENNTETTSDSNLTSNDIPNDGLKEEMRKNESDMAMESNESNAEISSDSNHTSNDIQNHSLKEEMKDSNQRVENEWNGRLDNGMIMNGDATDSIPAITPEDSMPPSISEASELPQADDNLPPPPSDLTCSPQELTSASDKMTELIPEIPSVPELKTELETTTDVAVGN